MNVVIVVVLVGNRKLICSRGLCTVLECLRVDLAQWGSLKGTPLISVLGLNAKNVAPRFPPRMLCNKLRFQITFWL